ncbi:MAG: hypothetical protein OEZ21_11865 [Candidatus Bathyarchaeota archaeon]|nr:hypothetical protein [Candidatus Bathyarchaeota archaeon]MDH5532685.1 hypothetical protein [Candidatus Bathyarchaeota archaeon]MDH5747627.1 hypothetical protein [Candidatus Bathyarchaeota archaeon]
MAFILGSYVGKLSRENPYKTGLKYVVLGIAVAAIYFFVRDFLKHLLVEQAIRIF